MPKKKTEKDDLSKLKRSELLEIMYAQSEEIDRLRAELAEKDQQLQDRRIAIQRSGSIAEASLALTKVFEEAQKAADLYVQNVKLQAQGQVRGQRQAQQARPTQAPPSHMYQRPQRP